MKVGELLLEAGLVDAEQIEAAMKNRDGLRLGSALIAARAVEPDVVARTLAQRLGVPPARSADLITPIQRPAPWCRWRCASGCGPCPYALHGSGPVRVLEVAMRDPEDQRAINELQIAAGMRIDARIAPELLLREALYTRAPRSRHPGRRAATGARHRRRRRRPRARSRRAGAARPRPGPPRRRPHLVEPAHHARPGATNPPLPPLQYDNSPANAGLTKALKWAGLLVAIVALGFVALRVKIA